MHIWLKIAEIIDGLNERIGRLASWLVLAVVLLGAWNAVARYLSRYTGMNLSSNAYLEAQWYLFSAIFMLGIAYTHKCDEHVRVDVWHASLRPKMQARIDVTGTIIFLIPLCLFILWSSLFPVYNSWSIKEMSPDPGGLPRYPVKTFIPLAFFLLLLQAISQLIKRWSFMREHSGQHPIFNIQHPTSNIQHSNKVSSSSIQNPLAGQAKSKIPNSDVGGSA